MYFKILNVLSEAFRQYIARIIVFKHCEDVDRHLLIKIGQNALG